MLEPILLFIIQTLASIQINSSMQDNVLEHKLRRPIDHACILCSNQVWEFEYHTLCLIWCTSFKHIWGFFQHIVNPIQPSMPSTLNWGKIAHSPLNNSLIHSCVFTITNKFHTNYMTIIQLWSYGSYLDSKNDDKIYLYIT